MKIKSIRSWKEDLELKRPYTIAYKTTDKVENAFVEIELENGLTGIGASNPSPYVVGESLDDAMQILEPGNLEWMVGNEIGGYVGICDKLYQKYPENPGARAALDIALHDLFSKYHSIPLVEVWGQKVKELATSVTIGIKNVDETIEEASEYMDAGFKILKVKLGQDLETDIERLVKLRERFGTSVLIRIDTNQGYNKEDFVEFFKRTEGLDIELNEQPLPANEVDQMKSLPEELKATIAADESLIDPRDAFELASLPRACGIFNIKLMKTGGLNQARKIINIAESSNTDLMWGCNDESIISITAALHAAFSSRNTKYIDLDGSFDLARDVVKGGFELKDGIMSLTGKPGLGVERI